MKSFNVLGPIADSGILAHLFSEHHWGTDATVKTSYCSKKKRCLFVTHSTRYEENTTASLTAIRKQRSQCVSPRFLKQTPAHIWLTMKGSRG